MRVAVRLFARAREVAGTERLVIELTEPADVRQLKERMREQCPQLAAIMPQLYIAVWSEYATDEARLDEQTDVACFPSVSGG